jgi:hypothetical protein
MTFFSDITALSAESKERGGAHEGSERVKV